jgi:hypothetical protein
MNENFEPVDEDQNLKNENEFLKMKLMLEQGAQFGTIPSDQGLPANIENEFLNYIMAYEKQAVERKMIKVFDRIQRPSHFRPVNEIPDNEIENAWSNLDEYLQKFGIKLSVCSPNISTHELYRFTTEELFEEEMNDMNIPGMTTCFTYDEFYPDYKYDNTRYAIDDCIAEIFDKKKNEWMPWLRRENLCINNHSNLTETDFKKIINRFKEAYEDIIVNEIKDVDFSIDENFCQVKGIYDITMKLPMEEMVIRGNWDVSFEKDLGDWCIVNVQIEGINF